MTVNTPPTRKARLPVVQEAQFDRFLVQQRADGTIRIAADPDVHLVLTELRHGDVWGAVYLRMEERA